MIICVTGLAGSGKTTVAQMLTTLLKKYHYEVVYYTTDFIQERLYIDEKFREGKIDRDFTADELKRVYNGLYLLVGENSKHNPSVVYIIDGTFREELQRLILEIIAKKNNLPFSLLYVTAEENKAIKRVNQRFAKTGLGGAVPADKYEEPLQPHIEIDNNGSMEALQQRIDAVITQLSIVPQL